MNAKKGFKEIRQWSRKWEVPSDCRRLLDCVALFGGPSEVRFRGAQTLSATVIPTDHFGPQRRPGGRSNLSFRSLRTIEATHFFVMCGRLFVLDSCQEAVHSSSFSRRVEPDLRDEPRWLGILANASSKERGSWRTGLGPKSFRPL